MTTVSGVTTSTTKTNTAWVENLVTQVMTAEKKPLTALTEDRDELNIQRGIYTDIQSKMSAFHTSIDSLIGTDNVFSQYTTSTSTSGIISSSVSLGASPASYSVSVSQLAQVNRLRSNQQTDNTSALNLSGSFSLNGKTVTVSAENSLIDLRDAINATTYDDDRGVKATIVDRRLILTSAESGSTSQLALEDLSGDILQSMGFFSRSVTDGDNLVTEHGVTGFTAGELTSFTSGALTGKQELSTGNLYVEIGSGKNANKFRLVDANGEAQAIASTSGGAASTTEWIAIDPANLAYDTGRGLIINFSNDSSWDSVSVGDGAANAVVDTSQLQAAKDAKLNVNGLNITRSSNTGLTDIIHGVTLNLQSTGTTQLTIGQNNANITNTVQSMLTNLNSLLNYLQAKTEPQKNTSTSTSTQTLYTPAALGNDWSLKTLRRNLVFDMLGTYSGAGTGEPKSLADIGIELDDDTLTFKISDQAALTSALSSNSEAVSDLFSNVFADVNGRISPYVDGASTLLTIQQKSIDDRIAQLNNRIDSTNARLVVRENALRTQYATLYAQILNWQNQGTEYTSMFSYLSSVTGT
jgi:flagellar capping protein FliD